MGKITGPAPGVGPDHLGGTQTAQEFREDIKALTTTVKLGKPNWSEASETLGRINSTLEELSSPKNRNGITQNRLNEIGSEDFSKLMDTLEVAAESAVKSKEWGIVDYIWNALRCLSIIGIFWVVQDAQNNDKIEDLPERAATLQAKVELWKAHSDYFEIRDGGDVFSPTGSTSSLSEDQAKAVTERFLLRQQEILRTTRQGAVDGSFTSGSVTIRDAGGTNFDINQGTLAAAGMENQFKAVSGDLAVADDLLTDGVIEHDGVRAMADAMVTGAGRDYGIDIKNLSGTYGANLSLVKGADGKIDTSVTRARPGRRQELQFDRMHDTIPGSDPAATFREALTEMTASDCTDARAKEINDQLYGAFTLDRDNHNVSATMSFQQYKLQFIPFKLDAMEQAHLRWNDASGEISAAEYAFLRLRAQDLANETEYDKFDVTISWEDEAGVDQTTTMPIYCQNSMDIETTATDYIKTFIGDDVEFQIDDIQGLGTETVKKNDFLQQMDDFSINQVRALLSDSKGVVNDPTTGKPMDVTARSIDAKALMGKMIHNNIMAGTFGAATENAGIGIGRLLKEGIPDSQKVFLRQSNGSDNADLLMGKYPVGQLGLIRGGQDTGAFGKCAPTSYFCGTMTTVSRQARSALTTLNESSSAEIRQLGTEIEALFTGDVLNDETKAELATKLDELKSKANGDAKLEKAHDRLTQLKTTVVDRMTFGADSKGPFIKMDFLIPKSQWKSDGYGLGPQKKSGMVEVLVRPEHIQEYLEATLRDDSYRGKMTHMSDFFKDPNAMNFGELFREMGVGLVAVGVDRALKEAGKKNGLLFGPGGTLLGTMILNREVGYEGVSLTRAEKAIGNLLSTMNYDSPADLYNALYKLHEFQQSTPLSDSTKAQYQTQYQAVHDAVVKERNDAIAEIKNRLGPNAMKMVPNSSPPVTFKECITLYFDKSTPSARKKEISTILDAGWKQAKASGDIPSTMTFNQYLDPLIKESNGMTYVDKIEKLYSQPETRTRNKAIKSYSSRIRSSLGWDAEGSKELSGRLASENNLPTLKYIIDQGGQKKADKLSSMIKSLKSARDAGGGIAVSMGYNGDTGHVNYVQEWGTPYMAGTKLDAKDVSRCIMNIAEDGGMSSAWKADRNIDTSIDIERLKVGLDGMRTALTGKSGTAAALKDLDELLSEVTGAVNSLEGLAVQQKYTDYAAMMADDDFVKQLAQHEPYQAIVRGLENKAYDFLQEHLSIKHEPGDLDDSNIVLMASNTERDNRVSDGAKDRFRVGRGNIGSQNTGTANALDGSYFVPLEMMASGWDSMVPIFAERYQDADPRDNYALLTSLTVVC